VSFRLSKRGKIFLAALHVGLFLLILKFGVGWLEDGRGSFQNSSSPALSTGKGKEGGEGFQKRKYPPPISEVLKRTGPFLARMDGKPLTARRTRSRRRGKKTGFRPVASKSSSVLNDFRLVGVWVDKTDRNFAIIESNSTKHQELVKEKGRLQSGATVLKVEPDSVILASGGEQRVLEIYFQPTFQVPPSFRVPPSKDPSRLLVMHPILSRVLFPWNRAPRLMSVLRGLNIFSSSQHDPIRAFNGRTPFPSGMHRLVVMRPVLFQADGTPRRVALVVMRPGLLQTEDTSRRAKNAGPIDPPEIGRRA
jgi:hypothetical protein